MPATATKKPKKQTRSTPEDAVIPVLDLEEFEPSCEPNTGVEDSFTGSVRFAWLGSGQCGGRLARTMYEMGYHKALAVNTTHHDLDLLDLPGEHKFLMDIGAKGAGKDMRRGKHAIRRYKQEVLHNIERIYGEQVDHIMVCFGAGGGTGSGSAAGLLEVAKDYARHIGIVDPSKAVGAVMTLPTRGEAKSPRVARNAYEVGQELCRMAQDGLISPLIIIDNDKINRMYPGLTVRQFWPTINNTMGQLFDIFNCVSSLPSPYTAFDHADYNSIMQAGGCAIMGLTRIHDIKDKFTISRGVRQNLSKTLLANGFNLKTAKVAGSIVVGGEKMMASVKGLQDNIDYAFDVLAEITGDATIHRGIYDDHREALRVYTIIGGLEPPIERLESLLNKQ